MFCVRTYHYCATAGATLCGPKMQPMGGPLQPMGGQMQPPGTAMRGMMPPGTAGMMPPGTGVCANRAQARAPNAIAPAISQLPRRFALSALRPSPPSEGTAAEDA